MTGFSRTPAWLLLFIILLAAPASHSAAVNDRSSTSSHSSSEQLLLEEYLPQLERYAQRPEIIHALQHAAAEPFLLEKTLQIDRHWQQNDSMRIRITQHPLSADFKQIVIDEQNTIREVMLIDRYGRLVASYPTASDYYQGDENKFIRPQQSHQRFIDKADWDDSSGSVAIQIATPVMEEQQFLGVVVHSLEVNLHILTRMQIDQ